MDIRVILVDDHQLVRDGIRAVLEKEKGIKVVAEANNGRDAVVLAAEVRPDVVIMDIAMAHMNGIEATKFILQEQPDAKILILSMHHDKSVVIEAIKARAKGYLLKDCASSEVVQAVRVVHRGEAYLSPKISSVVLENMMNPGGPTTTPGISVLSNREREVLELLADGKSTKEIAFTLEVSTKTIEVFRKRIMEKLDLKTIADLTKFAIREGLTSLE